MCVELGPQRLAAVRFEHSGPMERKPEDPKAGRIVNQ